MKSEEDDVELGMMIDKDERMLLGSKRGKNDSTEEGQLVGS